ncbi:tripartite tricarboxylate transporter substrate binding protein [Pigmentiphaga sp. H8]|uniref:Bug family tripartite tricarboxylate transporter substrate binding protein n=1 Tax=Pigmentiphaga sp. H8 TaxID=2488560 RepID=UPI000F59235E|nr:tripartite tricarboxylate transporter substrate binding protein [Pigmentiphaga sp. H8]AZG06607.1 tripartite tricarboxylate transporter substrate binding protein [Pigmentiphaga sp. H8]
MMSRLSCLSAIVLLSALQPAAAQPYPARPVKAVVPFPAGGAIDVAARLVLEGVAASLGQPIVVENKPGASGNIGTQQVARAPADGYTLLLGAAVNTAVSPVMYTKLDYSVDKDLTPLAQFGNAANLIYVHPSFPARTLAGVLEELKRHPGKYAYASPGSGTTVHLTMELLRARENLAVQHVPFKGSPAAISAVAGDQLKLGIDAAGPTLPFVQGERVVPVAVTASKRLAVLPDVPTFAEAGVNVALPSSYLGFYLPAGVPTGIAERLAAEVEKALARPEVAGKLRQLGVEPEFLGPQAFAARVKQERAMWAEAVKLSGATID